VARHPDFGAKEKIWSREDLKEIARNMAVLSEHSVREIYQRAYRECAIKFKDFPAGACRPGARPGVEAAEEMAEVTQSGMTETRREINECSRLLAAPGGS
jgi:hypothetical protein